MSFHKSRADSMCLENCVIIYDPVDHNTNSLGIDF